MSGIQSHQIVGIGEVLWDLLPGGARLGGATANFATFCARLGDDVSLVSSLGDDAYGKAAGEMLEQGKVDLSHLQTGAAYPTGVVEVSFSAGNQPEYRIATDVAWDFIRLTPQLLELASTADAICFGTLSQRHEVSRSTIQSVIKATKTDCVRVCDVNLRTPFCLPDVLAWSMGHATIIKVSDEELSLVLSLLSEAGMDGAHASEDFESAAHWLLAQFPKCELVAMTLGPRGSLLTNREETFQHPGFPITLVDTVGAGDAFTAGLVHAYLHGARLAAMAKIGNLCGSFVASRQGATPLLTPELICEIDALLVEAPSVARNPVVLGD